MSDLIDLFVAIGAVLVGVVGTFDALRLIGRGRGGS